jgi:hypothetical protein
MTGSLLGLQLTADGTPVPLPADPIALALTLSGVGGFNPGART